MHMNLCSLMSPLSLSRSKYFINFIDDFSKRTFIFFLKVRSETLNVFKIDRKEAKNQIDQKIKFSYLFKGESLYQESL